MGIREYDPAHIADLYMAAGHIQHQLPGPKSEENLLERHKILLLARTLELPGLEWDNDSVVLLTKLVDRTVDFVSNNWPHEFGAEEIIDTMLRPQFRQDLLGVVHADDAFFSRYIADACSECRRTKRGAAKLAQEQGQK